MSEEAGVGISAAEKFFGIILIIVGALATYFTFTSSQALGIYTGFFGFLSIVLIDLGLLLLSARAE